MNIMSVGPIIGLSVKIAEYFGLIEGVDTKVTKLLHQAFLSAKANLEFARTATGQNQIDYIKQAKIEFNQAVAVEENENKILALVGLAMCQALLGDRMNACSSLQKIDDVILTTAEKAKYIALDALDNVNPIIRVGNGLRILNGDKPLYPHLDGRESLFEQRKSNSLRTCKKLIE